jgi:hypothetical protein
MEETVKKALISLNYVKLATTQYLMSEHYKQDGKLNKV